MKIIIEQKELTKGLELYQRSIMVGRAIGLIKDQPTESLMPKIIVNKDGDFVVELQPEILENVINKIENLQMPMLNIYNGITQLFRR